MTAMETNVRQWYMETYPEDALGRELNPSLTFSRLLDALDEYQDVYRVMGLGDSVTRERLFDRLARLTGASYDAIYDRWMAGKEP